MKKKLIIILLGALVIIGGLMLAVNYKNNSALEEGYNPYGDKKLDNATIGILKDENYRFQTPIEDYRKKLENEETFIAYYFSPTCVYCIQTTPVLMEVVDEKEVEIAQFNLLEYPESNAEFDVYSTPTFVIYKDGVPYSEVVGSNPKEVYEEAIDVYLTLLEASDEDDVESEEE